MENLKRGNEEDADDVVVIAPLLIDLEEGIVTDVLHDVGYVPSVEEQEKLDSALSTIHLLLEINVTKGHVYVLGVR